MSNKVKAKPVKANKKRFPWDKVGYALSSLFNNGVCLEIATKLKWYWSLIVFVLTTLVSIIPATVTTSQTKGSAILTSTYSDSLRYGISDYALNGEDKVITIDLANNALSGTYESEVYSDYLYSGDAINLVEKPYYSLIRNGSHELDIYVVNSLETSDTTAINKILNTNPNYGDGSDAVRESLADSKYTRTSSFILFTNSSVYIRLYNNGTAKTSFSGNYKYLSEAFQNLGNTTTLHTILNVNSTSSMNDIAKSNNAITNFSSFLDKSLADAVMTQTWVTFGMYAGLNGGIMIVMGLVVFIMTRGKNNPNRTMKIWTCYSIAFWMSITPALIALAFGFFMSTLGTMLFILTYSFRIMFLSTKYLRPSYQQ